jgi:hypothetical protein
MGKRKNARGSVEVGQGRRMQDKRKQDKRNRAEGRKMGKLDRKKNAQVAGWRKQGRRENTRESWKKEAELAKTVQRKAVPADEVNDGDEHPLLEPGDGAGVCPPPPQHVGLLEILISSEYPPYIRTPTSILFCQ